MILYFFHKEYCCNAPPESQNQRWEAVPVDRVSSWRQYPEGPAPSGASHNTHSSRQTEDLDR